jgi:hypothetical protein
MATTLVLFAANRQPRFKYCQPVLVKIAAGFVKQQYFWRHGFQRGDGDHPALGGM